MKIRLLRNGKEWILLILFYLLLLQNVLGEWWSAFNYVDECLAMIGPVLYVARVLNSGRIVAKKRNMRLIAALMIFLLSGLLGNIIYDYQVTYAVLEDVYVNFKFFMSILTGYELYVRCRPENCRRIFLSQAKVSAVILFLLLLIDLVFEVFESMGTRYGMRVVQLSYGHPTYLAGAMVYLMMALTLYYEKKNDLYLFLAGAVLFFTLRGKAIGGLAVYFLVYFFILKQRKKLRIWHVLLLAVAALVVAWEQFSFYYVELEGTSARSALTQNAFVIAHDYFPIGTGFGTYASNVAAEHYSPVYLMYGLNYIHGLSETDMMFGSDTFWPIIIGQTGVIGTIYYLYVLIAFFRRVLRMKGINHYAYSCGIFMFAYFAISSTSEPTFCNAVSIPLALLLGFIFAIEKSAEIHAKIGRMGDSP